MRSVLDACWREGHWSMVSGCIAAFALAVVFAAAGNALSAPPSADYAVAWEQSEATGRPLVVLVGAAWCAPCMIMKTAVLPAVAEAGGLEGVAFTYVDVDRHPELARCLSGGGAIPQLIRYTKAPSGWMREVIVGLQNEQQVTAFVQRRCLELPETLR